MGTVGIVCDSTCDVGPDWRTAHDVVMVPLEGLSGAVRRKALQEMAATVAEDFKDAPVRLSILHSVAPALAEEQREALDAAGARYTIAGVVTVGAVIGTYAGPGAVGIAYYPES